ncbi:glycosyltransferase family 39 protein [Acidocella sp.]|jgi:4-amino-4-deoxy-L-arabinose transferase-like glycosyltransferase|uniref:glycosyltransferase family 39 protein n=1 Tax=Acidocella sp. TaxID=50710 RepID=UPI002F40EF88
MNAVWVVLLATVLRLVFANFTGLGIDESYMVAASDHFAASYFDHPLVSWWLELGSRALFHSMAPIVVRLPFILLSAVSSWLIYRITARLYTRGAAFWAVVAYNISPVFSLAFGSWVLPDGPLDTALLAALYAMLRALGIAAVPTPPQPRWWLAAGFFAGLACLSKYNAALVLAGAGLAMLSDPLSRRELRRFAPWVAAVLAVAMFMPVIWWNATHGWQSFAFQGDRATGLRLHPLAPLTVWGGEALFLLPWLWLPMVCLQIGALRRGPAERRGWLLSLLGLLPVVLFSVFGIWSSTKILYHWATPGYLMLLPMLGSWAENFAPRLRNTVAALSAFLLAFAAMFIAAEATLNFIPGLNHFFPPGKSPLLQIVDWDTAAAGIPRQAQAVVALRWFDAGKIGYALRDRLPVTVFGADPHEFGIATPPASLLHKNILILAMPGNVSQIADEYAPDFMLLRPGPALTVMHGHDVLLVIPTLIGTDLRHVPGT